MWLKSLGITHVAMKSTGVFWKPVHHILEDSFNLLLVNARHIKNVPGRKTDVLDSEWICKLLRAALLRGSFVPPKPIRELRDLVRYRKKQIEVIASEKQRIQKFLEDANIKLASVVSDTSGVTATQMIDELIKGDKSPKEISLLAKGKLKNKLDALEMALERCFTDHHKFMIQTAIKRIESTAESIEELDVEINNRIIIIEASEYVDLLKTIPGVGRRTAEVLIAEVGTNMNQFPNEAHLSSWSGLSPGNNQSGGKKKSAEQLTETRC
jgi:transposase